MNFFVAIAFIMVFILTLTTFHFKNNAERNERNYEQITRHLDSKSGGTSMLTDGEFINYQLKTFDSGKTWYAIEYDDDWGVTILGEAEDIFPGLLQHLEAMNELQQYVQENGPIRGFQSGEIKLLENAGFEVTEKK